LSGASGGSAGATTYQYNVNLTFGSDGVSGSILTDCNSGTLSQTDIVGWSLVETFSKPGAVAYLPLGNSLGSAASGEHFSIFGNDLIATPSGIYFDFTDTATSGAQIVGTYGGVNEQFSWYSSFGNIPGSSDLPGFYLMGLPPGGGNPQVQYYFPESGVFRLATLRSVERSRSPGRAARCALMPRPAVTFRRMSSAASPPATASTLPA
jgi:hypothetical protein